MSRPNPLANLAQRVLSHVQAGRTDEAARLLELLPAAARDPSFCNQESLEALKKARTLALIQRSHIQRRLRSLAVSRLYRSPGDPRRTWQIDA